MKRSLVLLLLMTAFAVTASAQTMYQQTSHRCLLQHCYNATLDDGETFSYTDGIQYYGTQSFIGSVTFRGQTYSDFQGTVTATTGPQRAYTNYWSLAGTFNNGADIIQETIAVTCYRGCSQRNVSGSVTIQ